MPEPETDQAQPPSCEADATQEAETGIEPPQPESQPSPEEIRQAAIDFVGGPERCKGILAWAAAGNLSDEKLADLNERLAEFDTWTPALEELQQLYSQSIAAGGENQLTADKEGMAAGIEPYATQQQYRDAVTDPALLTDPQAKYRYELRKRIMAEQGISPCDLPCPQVAT